jgi:hypothetical protein
VYNLLLGFAAENYLKAALVFQNRETIEREVQVGAKVPPRLLTHDLRRLVQDVGFSLTEDEIPVLDAMRVRVEWSGRYPVPVRVTDTDGSNQILGRVWVRMGRDLVRRMRAVVVAESPRSVGGSDPA